MAVIGCAARTLLREKMVLSRLSGVMSYASESGDGKPAITTPPVKPQAAAKPPPPAAEPKPDITSYKVKEYYAHREFSFYDIDSDMKQHRLQQPSSLSA